VPPKTIYTVFGVLKSKW